MNIRPDMIIAVLLGGVSSERDVSLKSGESVVTSLRNAGYMVLEIDINTMDAKAIKSLLTPAPDVVFNALHGTAGEDGYIQNILNDLGIPYTHSGVRASKVAFNKPQTIDVYKHVGIPVAVSVRMHPDDFCHDILPFSYPYVIKPACGGSSVGLYIVHTPDDIPYMKDWAYGDIMVEQFVDGLELTVSVLGERVLGITELIPLSGVYDYESKYTDGKTLHKCNDVSVCDTVADAMKHYAITAHKALGCRGVSRTDFRYDPKTDTLIALETNTQPGLTSLSLLPEQALDAQISFLDLILEILKYARVD